MYTLVLLPLSHSKVLLKSRLSCLASPVFLPVKDSSPHPLAVSSALPPQQHPAESCSVLQSAPQAPTGCHAIHLPVLVALPDVWAGDSLCMWAQGIPNSCRVDLLLPLCAALRRWTVEPTAGQWQKQWQGKRCGVTLSRAGSEKGGEGDTWHG